MFLRRHQKKNKIKVISLKNEEVYTQNSMVKGMSLHSRISVSLKSIDKILRFFRTMKHVDYSSSRSKGNLKPSLEHF
jgi:hypothetical protein